MPITVRNGLTPSLRALGARVEGAALEGSHLMALALEGSIKGQIQGGHPKGTKTGARPGGPPENITGTLRRSVVTGHPHWLGAGRAATQTGPTTVYGRAVDLGHPRWKDGVKYPYVEPGVKQAEDSGQLHAIASEVIWNAIRGV